MTTKQMGQQLHSELLSGMIRVAGLPDHYLQMAEQHILPLTAWIASHHQPGEALVIGINGGQGSGKSSLCNLLQQLLISQGYNTATLSIDDLYLTRQKRAELAISQHPLLKTRGVPGTHDVKLGIHTLNQLINTSGDTVIPRFDKSIDDRLPQNLWPRCRTPVDIVLFEGWCVATEAEPDDQLITPVNSLESSQDRAGVWRRFVNEQLKAVYPQLFACINHLVFLQAPGFDALLNWRMQQELQIFQGREKEAMSRHQLIRFMQHFERLTLANLQRMPERADVILKLDRKQNIINAIYHS